jgi:hypothetical protein
MGGAREARSREKGSHSAKWLWPRGIPGHSLENRAQVQPGCSERGHMQRLTDMAGGVRAMAMLVKKRTASREKEQGGTRQHGERRSPVAAHKNSSLFFHETKF